MSWDYNDDDDCGNVDDPEGFITGGWGSPSGRSPETEESKAQSDVYAAATKKIQRQLEHADLMRKGDNLRFEWVKGEQKHRKNGC